MLVLVGWVAPSKLLDAPPLQSWGMRSGARILLVEAGRIIIARHSPTLKGGEGGGYNNDLQIYFPNLEGGSLNDDLQLYVL